MSRPPIRLDEVVQSQVAGALELLEARGHCSLLHDEGLAIMAVNFPASEAPSSPSDQAKPRWWQDADVIVRTDGTREGTTVELADGSPIPFLVSGVEWRVGAGGRPEVAIIAGRARLAVGP